MYIGGFYIFSREAVIKHIRQASNLIEGKEKQLSTIDRAIKLLYLYSGQLSQIKVLR